MNVLDKIKGFMNVFPINDSGARPGMKRAEGIIIKNGAYVCKRTCNFS